MEKESEKVSGETKEVTPPIETKEAPKATEVPERNPNDTKVSDDAKASEVEQEAKKLANIQLAVQAEEARLREIRKKQKQAKQGLDVDEDELPQIDFKDPSAKAWDKRIYDTVAPTTRELEKAKEERRLFTLKKFLSDKPDLAKNPTKIQAMMETYDRLKTSTELTSEGIEMDLEKAYAAEHYDELINKGQQQRVEKVKNDAIFSDPAVSRGSTAYSDAKPKSTKTYSKEEEAILAKWGMTPSEHAAMSAEQEKKA